MPHAPSAHEHTKKGARSSSSDKKKKSEKENARRGVSKLVRDAMDFVECGVNEISHPSALEDLPVDQVLENMSIKVISLTPQEMVFDLVGVDTAVANALRRVLIAEVPTMAIEKVFILNNTSVIQDEVLSHRLGLIPIRADPRLYCYRFPPSADDGSVDGGEQMDDVNGSNTIVFKLDIKCDRQGPGSEGIVNGYVYSRHLEFVPEDGGTEMDAASTTQTGTAVAGGVIRPVHEDILIARLQPGQSIDLQAHCEKGIGATHAKWSPVATASYRLLPDIVIGDSGILGNDAHTLVKRCPMGVFDLEDLPVGHQASPAVRAVVKSPRSCSMCRECIRIGDEISSAITLRRHRSHFIFTVESTGALDADSLVTEAISVLREKVKVNLEALRLARDAMMRQVVPPLP